MMSGLLNRNRSNVGEKEDAILLSCRISTSMTTVRNVMFRAFLFTSTISCVVSAIRGMKYLHRVICLLFVVLGVLSIFLLWDYELVHIKVIIGVGIQRQYIDSSSIIQRHIVSSFEDAGNSERSATSQRSVRKEPTINIAFLKVHKAASSTVQNILFRYGMRKNLTFVLPRPPGFYWRNVISLRKSVSESNIIPPPRNKTFNILCSHLIYNHTAFRSVMPNSTKYIGILREPHSQFLSMLHYTNTRVVFNKNTFGKDPIAKYLENPSLYEYKDPYKSYTNNRMAVEFGFPEHLFESRNLSEIKIYLRKLDTEFDLVMITEMFDESLILLKRLLSWNIKDIIYASLNKNKIKHKRYRWTKISNANFNKWKLLDVELYRYFRKRLIERIRKEGHSFWKEVKYFKHVQRNVQSFCNGTEREALKFEESEFSEAFEVNKQNCWHISLYEIIYVDIIRYNQYPELGMPKDLSIVDYNRAIHSFNA